MVIILTMSFLKLSRFAFVSFYCLLFAIAGSAAGAGVSVTLYWDHPEESDVAGYRVHYGPLSAPYTQLLDVETTSVDIPNLVASTTYIFAVSAYNTAGVESAYSSPIAHFVTATPLGGQQVTLDNISSRAFVQTGDNVMIGGFIVQSNTPKTLVLRAIGPSLAANGVQGALDDPVLELHNNNVVIFNDNWKDSQAAAIQATGAPPIDDRESAILQTLATGRYTALMRGKGDATGVGLIEVYDLEQSSTPRLSNISARGVVGLGDNVMIGGFIIGGGLGVNGHGSGRVIVRGIGPTLTQSGISGALQDPVLELHNSNGTLVAFDDNWKDAQQSEIAATGLAPKDDRESAIATILAQGTYTAILRGRDGTTGIALVEVYNVP